MTYLYTPLYLLQHSDMTGMHIYHYVRKSEKDRLCTHVKVHIYIIYIYICMPGTIYEQDVYPAMRPYKTRTNSTRGRSIPQVVSHSLQAARLRRNPRSHSCSVMFQF